MHIALQLPALLPVYVYLSLNLSFVIFRHIYSCATYLNFLAYAIASGSADLRCACLQESGCFSGPTSRLAKLGASGRHEQNVERDLFRWMKPPVH